MAVNRDWELFYNQYRDVIFCFSRRQGLDESAACDVLQETMVLLMRKSRRSNTIRSGVSFAIGFLPL
jgi:DNA-directed RNA polymerase specialized sigma24 family protein